MDENRTDNNIHRRLSPSAKRKQKRARAKRRLGIIIAILAIFVALGWLWFVPRFFDAEKPAAASGNVQSDAESQLPEETPNAAESASSESEPSSTSSQTTELPSSSAEQPEDPMKNINVTWNTKGIEGYDYLIAINRAADCVTVYSKDADGNYLVPFKSMICSTGEDTPLGEYRTIEQYRWRYLFGDVYGQYAVRIVEHILFHSVPYLSQDPADLEYEEFNKLGTPASMGCIRLQVADVKWIYDNCPLGTPVVLYDDAENPGPLGKPSFTPVDVTDEKTRGWDPTDPDPRNPWNKGIA